ncbi:hypothetical protein C0R09_07195 [Brevibacillus laterosporus]|uniref:hypothetical protein n=1 Tax=Brevibacillus laterosporus TaxID=1465 RepID=UPI000C759BE5|nr:hypothetical protein [Brevibacillus laterosporus]AUM64336.1 hypothetical protein C0R09_07195 [Brevibacillus laterosporus]
MANRNAERRDLAAKRFYKECKKRGYRVLGAYKNSIEKVRLLCKNGHDYYAIPKNFIYLKHSCLRCKKFGKEQARAKWEALVSGNRYSPLEKYKGAKHKILVTCNVCGKDILVVPYELYLGIRGCPCCSGNDKKTAAENFYRKLELNNVKPLEEYQGKYSFVKVQHKTCGEVYRIQPCRYMYGEFNRARCKKCSRFVTELLLRHKKGEISTKKVIEIVQKNGWETRLEDLENELLERDYRNACCANKN